MTRRDWRKLGPGAAKFATLATFVVLLAFPFYWMLIATFKQNIDLYTVENNPFKFNLPPTLDHLKLLFFETRYVRWLGSAKITNQRSRNRKQNSK